MTILTLEQLLAESKKIAESQSEDFREALLLTAKNTTDPAILELINIISSNEGQQFVTLTRV